MSKIQNWLANAHSQMAKLGLTDPNKKPDNVPCGTCGTPIMYHWHQKPKFSYWAKGSCWKCREAENEKRAEKRRIRILEEAGVPLALHNLDLELSSLISDGANSHVQTAVEEWSPPQWLMLTGPVGTGKTLWLTALFNWLVTKGKGWSGSRWITESDLFHRCDTAHHNGGYTARQSMLVPFIEAPILMLDDLAASRRPLTEWQGSAMRNIMDKRHSSNSPTFITTNMVEIADLERRYGDHIISRILHATNGLIYLGGPDRRKS